MRNGGALTASVAAALAPAGQGEPIPEMKADS